MRRAALALLLGCGGDVRKPPATVDAHAEAGEALVALIGQDVVLDGTGSTGTAFRWNLGQGDSVDGLSPTTRYDAPGHYTASLTATAADGTTDVDTVAVTIHLPVASPPPRHSSTLVEVDGSLILTLNDHDALARIDLESHAVTLVDTCAAPRSLAVGVDAVAVACELDEVRVYSRALAERRRIELPWGSRPFGLVYDDAGTLQVTLQGTGELAAIDAAGGVQTRFIGPDLRGIAAVDGALVLSRHRSEDSHGQLWRVDDGAVQPWTLPPDPGPDSDTDARGVPTYLQRVVPRPDGQAVVTGGLKANIGRGLWRDGNPLTHESTTRAVVRQLALDGTELPEPTFDDRDLVSAMAFSPLGDWLYVAFLGDGSADIVDSYTMERVGGFHTVGQGLDGLWVREDPPELYVYAALSRELVVYDLTDPFGTQVELARIDLTGGRPEPLGAEGLLGKTVFYGASDGRLTATGYMSCGSCHLDGDHDGRTWDFTDRGEGLRNTISLLGRGGSTPLHWTANFDELQDFENDIRGPMAGRGFLTDLDWVASMDPLGTPKAGRSPELDALAAWITSLDQSPRSPVRDPGGALTTDALAGEQIFLSPEARCADCHPPPEYTDSGFQGPGLPRLHDVGTLTPASGQRIGQPLIGLDTPSLRGLASSAPYLHDGSAVTVLEILDQNRADDLHGTTAHLDSAQLDQLEAFLLSLE